MTVLARVLGADVSRETFERLELYVELLRRENEHQNLIARSTLDDLWARHILDSAQLINLMPDQAGSMVDLGSGAGLPGMVVAILRAHPITLLEPRRLRAEFLRATASELGLEHVTVEQLKAERAIGKYDVITARAVATIDRLFTAAHHLSKPGTMWILPKGRSGRIELEEARHAWQGCFRLEPSMTDGEAAVIVATGVTARAKGRA